MPAITGNAILPTTLHINMIFLQIDRTQVFICQQEFLSQPEPVAQTILKTFQRRFRLVSMHCGHIR